MATHDHGERPRRRDVFVSLAAELQIRRSGVHGADMAERLLGFEDGRALVGVGHAAERAIYYETASRSLVAVRFDKHGVDAETRELLHRDLGDPTAWVAAYGGGFAWVHPRYGADG